MPDKRKCIRCFFAGERLATDEVRVTYGAAEYALDLCSKHAQEFDDAMWSWLRVAREVDTSINFQNTGLSERLRDAPAVREAPRAPVTSPPAPTRKGTLPPLDVLAVKWLLSEHAQERLEERGALHGFGLKEVLYAAEAPEHSWPSKRGDGTWYRQRNNVGVLVNPEQRVIVTVLGPKESDEAATARTA